MEDLPEPSRPALADVRRLTPRPSPSGASGVSEPTTNRPSVLGDLRRRAPQVWSTVRRHPAVRAATSRAGGWSAVRNRSRAPSDAAHPSTWPPRAGRLAPVLPLRPPAPVDGVDGLHDAVVVDLARYRAARRPAGRGTA